MTVTQTSANQTATRPATPPPAAPPTDGVSGISTPALLLVLVGVFLAMADFFIVNVALSDIGTSLHASASTLELGAGRFDLRQAQRLQTGVEVSELAPVA